MSDFQPLFDSWPFKFAILGVFLALRYALTFKVRPRGEKARNFHQWGRETLDSWVLTVAVVFFFVNPFVAQAFYIPTGSMENTLPPGDKIMVSKWIYRLSDPQKGDVVVFEAPDAALAHGNDPPGTFFVKRCIGVPGDVIEIRNRRLFRNGVEIAEPYTKWKDGNEALLGWFSYDLKIVGGAVYSRQHNPFNGQLGVWTKNDVMVPEADQNAITTAPAGKVPSDRFLMLGDHRNNSLDGHVWGFVPRPSIIGKAFAVFWPPRHLGLVDRKSGF